MALPTFAEIRQLRVQRALDHLGLRWLPAEPAVCGIVGDEWLLDGIAAWDDFTAFHVVERVDLRLGPDPTRYQYGLSYGNASGEHVRREVHLHDHPRGVAGDECSEQAHRHRYVGYPGRSIRPHLAPCTPATIEEALEELLRHYLEDYPTGTPVRLRS